MDSNDTMLAMAAVSGALLVGLVIIALVLVRVRREVPSDRALIVGRAGGAPRVYLRGPVVVVGLTQLEWLSLSAVDVPISLRGKDAVRCSDGTPLDLELTFRMQVPRTTEDVLRVARSVGCARASDPAQVAELFRAQLVSGVRETVAGMAHDEAASDVGRLRDRLMMVIGVDLGGFVLDDVAVVHVSSTPMEFLDPHDVRDAEVIARITRRTASANIAANEARIHEQREIGRMNLEAQLAIQELERVRAETEARMQREIAVVRALEEAEILRVQQEEHQKTYRQRLRLLEETAAAHPSGSLALDQLKRDMEALVRARRDELEAMTKAGDAALAAVRARTGI